MAWSYYDSATIENGSLVVQIHDGDDLHHIQAGWGIIIDGRFVEVSDGTPFVDTDGYATAILAQQWAGTTQTAVPAIIVPVNAPLIQLLQQFETSAEILEQVTSQFPALTGTEQDFALIVDASGDGFEAVTGQEFLFRTGLEENLQTIVDANAQIYLDTLTAQAEAARDDAQTAEAGAEADAVLTAADVTTTTALRTETLGYRDDAVLARDDITQLELDIDAALLNANFPTYFGTILNASWGEQMARYQQMYVRTFAFNEDLEHDHN